MSGIGKETGLVGAPNSVQLVEFDGCRNFLPCLELWLRSGSKTELESDFDGGDAVHLVVGVHDVGEKMHEKLA